MTWLVTGSDGFIAGRLLASMPEAIGIDRFYNPHETGDITRIVHLGALSGIGECSKSAKETLRWNVEAALYRVAQADTLDVPLVFASSAAAAMPTGYYAASKAMLEAWCEACRQERAQPISILRFANVYGPGSTKKTSVVATMCRDAILKGTITVHAPGDQVRDLVHVDDVIKAIHLAPDGLWGVRTGKQISMIDLAEFIKFLSNATIRFLPAPITGVRIPCDESPQLALEYQDWIHGVEETFAYFKEQLDVVSPA